MYAFSDSHVVLTITCMLTCTHMHVCMHTHAHMYQQFGGQCVNADNPGDPCKDYMVQYIHPCKKNITLSLPINVPAAKAETEADLDLLDKLFSLDNERE